MSTEELLALILGRGVVGKSVFELSKELSDYLSKLPKVPTVAEIQKIRGIGQAKASQIVACLELSSRFLLASNCETTKSPEDCVRYFSFLKFEPREHFAMISLNSANIVVGTHLLTSGVADRTLAHPREAFVKAIEDRAVAVIFAHNHPSGSVLPSKEDLKLTQILVAAGNLLQINMLDHIIVGPSGFCSLRRKYPDLFENNVKNMVF